MITSLMTLEEVATYLKVKPSWIYARTRSGLIPHRKLGNHLRFDVAEIDAWAKKHAVGQLREVGQMEPDN